MQSQLAQSSILRPSKYATAVLNEPLLPNKLSKRTDSLSSDDDSASAHLAEQSSTSSDDLAIPKSMFGSDIVSTVGVGVLSVAGLAASLSAMIAFPGAAVILMGGICMANSPVVAKKHINIAKGAGLRTSVNMIREEVEFLTNEVKFLQSTIDDLQAEADVLVGVESKLQLIAKKQGTNAEHLVSLVNENELLLSKMKNNLKETFVAGVLKIVIRSDTDGDMKIDLKELPLLSIRLQLHLDPYGIKLDKHMFETMIKEDNDISNVLKFCGDVLYGDDEDEDNGNDDVSVDSQVTFDFEAFCQEIDEDSPHRMSRNERRSMVTIDEKFSKGSVEVARGHRMTLHKPSNQKEMRKKTILEEVNRRQTKVTNHKHSLAVRESRDRKTRITLGGLVTVRGTSAEI
mmetsp:Transcript_11389/g.24702  ORF Transcript_11389/g.24702 Transcript_11389/m.24702 type:complete len:401 (-) Transcript_11389:206-1408(-)